MTNNDLRRVLSKCVLGLAERSDIVALAAILDGPGQSVLTNGEGPFAPEVTAVSNCRMLLDVARDAGIPIPSNRDAVLVLSREVAAAIVSGEQDWLTGSEAIWKIELSTPERIPELDTFLYAAMEAEANPNLGTSFEAGVLEAARDLLKLPPQDD